MNEDPSIASTAQLDDNANSFYLSQAFYDVQKLLVQEKGEDKYYEIRNKKARGFKRCMDDILKREQIVVDSIYYPVGQK